MTIFNTFACTVGAGGSGSGPIGASDSNRHQGLAGAHAMVFGQPTIYGADSTFAAVASGISPCDITTATGINRAKAYDELRHELLAGFNEEARNNPYLQVGTLQSSDIKSHLHNGVTQEVSTQYISPKESEDTPIKPFFPKESTGAISTGYMQSSLVDAQMEEIMLSSLSTTTSFPSLQLKANKEMSEELKVTQSVGRVHNEEKTETPPNKTSKDFEESVQEYLENMAKVMGIPLLWLVDNGPLKYFYVDRRLGKGDEVGMDKAASQAITLKVTYEPEKKTTKPALPGLGLNLMNEKHVYAKVNPALMEEITSCK